MFLTTAPDGHTVVYTSASDLTAASKCEFAFVRALDARLGRIEELDVEPDAMLERTSTLGDQHEARVLAAYKEEREVVEIARVNARSAEELDAAASATLGAFQGGADVVFQATFHERGTPVEGVEIAFLGFADFIVRGEDGRYIVQDTKLARSAKVTALLQLAAYAEQMARIGVPVSDTVELILGDGRVSPHSVADIAPVYRRRRERLHRIIRERMAAASAVEWGDPEYTICGRCDVCDAEVQASRDVLLVANLRVTQHVRLAEAGIRTIDELAASTGSVEGIADSTLAGLRAQAQLQLQAMDDIAEHAAPPFKVVDPAALSALPAPDPGDIFFDFEGDPLYTEGDSSRWGLDYLFGYVDSAGEFTAYWAHDFAEEKQALRAFLEDVAERRRRNPGMHIYHYASYERTHLAQLAARHGSGEDEVDQLLREHVLVDLYPIVSRALRVGSRSYSIKKLEPLYMGSELRDSEGVTNAADSIVEYAAAVKLRDAGDDAGFARKLEDIADYNRYDCVSTLRLRDWLLGLADEEHIEPTVDAATPELLELEPSPLHDALMRLAGDGHHERTADERAAAFAAAAIDYHRREQKTFWWGHFSRLVAPIQEWADTRDVFIVDRGSVETDWYREGRQRTDRRVVRLHGTWGPGSSVKPGGMSGPFALYEQPAPFTDPRAEPGARSAKQVTVLEVDDDSALIQETLRADCPRYDVLPVALTPGTPPPAGQQRPAIEEWAQAIVDSRGTDGDGPWPKDAAVDILRRTPPRTVAGTLPDASDEDYIRAVTAACLDLDDSYLAVQGPPGTGKTYLASHVIAELVEKHGWKIGVVAQSHAVVENVLSAVVSKAGLDASRVGKVTEREDCPFTALAKEGHLLFAASNPRGYVIGGTAWDLANPARIPRRSLDLLVIDEAGQFSLASTIAASVAAHNLLLLGDPQQLPQVSQGTHPEPIDGSALGWISDGHDVLPAELGYFLAASRRMHPAVTAPVSTLSYAGALHSHPDAAARHLDGIEAGLHPVPVDHWGNAVESGEEASEVLRIVEHVLGRTWADGDPRPLTQDDVIVVSPYNAQVALVHGVLARAGYGDVRVGTVDKFQGQEAVIAIVTLAASSPVEAPRGMAFLLMRNRLNVAISRAQWAAYLVHSPHLTEYLPATPHGVAELSAFITLVE
ncbi:TM0106 family RecB-like putative nuclease [Salinibacterium sp. SYSU T00001]|uniref:TM0106 family RecB-like putative nuclease n=1 Tax=Homoserinimonas sedimenticola TaxID=2986805 RepID=UPI00223682D5|nr:bifunctional RecB family nuclease/DEAD/DEAH box helicase [Salinibacterium sedimenticola]MCW4386341.1 TM0106 family RecB-like putative nuclease [Salinibacterium sedimenticola]